MMMHSKRLDRKALTEILAELRVPSETRAEFSTEAFLASVLAAGDFNEKDLQTLDRLSKKIDVVKKLRTTYTLDLSRAGKKSSTLSLDYFVLAIGVMLLAAKERGDLKFLNTALNGLDLMPSEARTTQLQIWANELLVEMI